MSSKDGLTRLDDIDLLDGPARAVLRAASITTVEDLLGALQADPDGVASALSWDASRIAVLIQEARRVLPAETLRLLDQVVPKRTFLESHERGGA